MAIARLDLENLHLDLAHSRLTDASMKVVGVGWVCGCCCRCEVEGCRQFR